MPLDQQNYYWLFSSSAQSVSAFVAFLLTGFALVLNMMDNQQQKDETLEDIHTKLKSDYYKRILWLAIISGLAIVLSLVMVYINGITLQLKIWFFAITALINLIAIVFGIYFVIKIINPNRYKIAVKEIIKENKFEVSAKELSIDQSYFMSEFIALEKLIRNKLKSKELYVSYGEAPKMIFSFRQMINTLFQNELINRNIQNELLQINKYRNLVFHGHQDKVDKVMLKRIVEAKKIIEKI